MNSLPGKHGWRRIVVAAVLVALVTIWLAHVPLLQFAGRWLNVSTQLAAPVDDVMVLGGDLELRPLVAASIVRSGLARRVLITQVVASDEVVDGMTPPHHEIVHQVLLRSGVSADAVDLLPVIADSTQDEARCLSEYLASHPGRRVAVVTSDYHSRRTKRVFIAACGDRAADLSFIGAPTDGFAAENWWRFEPGFVQYVDEYLKLFKSLVL
ncbi:MAG: YdcF family protein [Planctomycetia bacterium]|nr:YdcF family protein [Planctomycetia bacterium]